MITARAENLIRDVDDLDDTIARLQAFAAAGADVLFAPGLSSAEQIRAVLSSVELPLSVLVVPGVPPLPELAELGVRRVSVGGAFAFAAYGALVRAAREMLDDRQVRLRPARRARARRGRRRVRLSPGPADRPTAVANVRGPHHRRTRLASIVRRS